VAAFPLTCLALILMVAAHAVEPVKPISDERIRLGALRLIFPEMTIGTGEPSRTAPPKPKPGEMFFPDAMAGEPVYRVTGNATNEVERCASENLSTRSFSRVRSVQLKLFPWPHENPGGMLAVLQYGFSGAAPALSCPSIGLLVHITREQHVGAKYLLETVHHWSLQKVDLVDLSGSGFEKLVIESDFGGAGSVGSTLQIFDLSYGGFEELLTTDSRIEYMDEDAFTQTLDYDQTLRLKGRHFCCVKTVLVEHGHRLRTPQVTLPCYDRDSEADTEDARARQKMLRPVKAVSGR